MTTSSNNKFELNNMFKAKVAAKEAMNASMVDIGKLEESSGNMIAICLAHALEDKGAVKQVLPFANAREYVYVGKDGRSIEGHAIALMGVVLAGVLIHLDDWYDLEQVVHCEVFAKRYMRIAALNRAIIQYDDNLKIADYQHKLRNALKLCIDSGLLERDDQGRVRHTMKYLGSCISRKSVMHQTDIITKDDRRKERVKSRMNAMKDGTSRRVRKNLMFIESQAQVVNEWLLDALLAARDRANIMGAVVPSIFRESEHVLLGCSRLRGQELYSEYFMDLRGRMYQFAHCGPNPQASDMAKALCYHNVGAVVQKDSPQYEMFINEMFNEVCEDPVWQQEVFIRRVAANPVGALEYAFNNYKDANGSPCVPFKKFFSYMDMCRTWVDFQDKGEAVSYLGFGPDAKCSGAQIFSILAGCKTIGESCGLITGYQVKPADPYKLSAQSVNKIAQRVAMKLVPCREISRNEIKTPFMAIQYGGGVPALRYKKFEPTMEALGIAEENRDKFCSDVVIAGIKDALGERIEGFIDGLRKAVDQYCREHDVDSFSYKHIDGFKVTKTGEASVALSTEPFIINYDSTKQGVIFGSMKEESGWTIPSQTSGILQRTNFIHYFPVHFVQGMDAVVARAIANEAQDLGLRGYTTIHDQFRTCLADAPRLRAEAVPNAYKWVFMDNDPIAFLEKQMGITIQWGNPLEPRRQILTEEVLYSTDAYYFE